MYIVGYVGYTPQFVNTSQSFRNYTQQFNLSIPFNKSSTDSIQVMPFLMSITNAVYQGFSFFNISQYQLNSNNFYFTLNVTYSMVQSFCLSVLTCHFTNLKKYSLQNATFFDLQSINSTSANTLSAAIKNNFGIYSVYGPVYDYKCVIGLSAYNIQNQGLSHSVWFDFTSSPNTNSMSDVSSPYTLAYSSFCFVDLQCQYLYQQYYVMINDCQSTCTLSNCATCTTSTSCSLCATGYFLNSLLRCQACITNCSNCSNNVTCDNCIAGYYFNATAAQCQPCALNCLTCNSASCLTCVTGYFPNTTFCTPCGNTMPNCISCANSFTCSVCR